MPKSSRSWLKGAATKVKQDRQQDAIRFNRPSLEGREIDYTRASVVVSLALFLWVMFFTPLGRYLTYDEATFYGQSGGLNGIEIGRRPWMAASREYGTPSIIGLIRTFTATLASTQLVWTIVSVVLTLVAFWEVGRWTGRRGALVGAAVYMTCWVSTALAGSFYGSFIGAAAGLLTMGLYLRLRYQEDHVLRNGLLLGLATSLLMAMRNLESVLALSVIVAHAALWRPRETLNRWRGIIVAAVTFTVVYVIPWTLVSVSRFGSVIEMIRTARAQGHPFALHNGFGEWFRVLLGIDPHFADIEPLPLALRWFYGALFIVMALVSIAFVVERAINFLRREPVEGEARHTGLILAFASVSLGLFFLFSQEIRERYLAFGLAAGALLFGHAVVDAYRRWGDRLRSRPAVAGVAVVAALWLLANGIIMGRVQHERVTQNAKLERLGGMLNTIASGRPCRVVGDASSPPIQIASGCQTGRGRGQLQRGGVDSLAVALEKDFPDAEVIFVVWSGRPDPAIEAAMEGWEEREGGRCGPASALPMVRLS